MTKDAIIKELKISKVKLKEILKANPSQVEIKTLLNLHNRKPFNVYNLDDLKNLIQRLEESKNFWEDI